MKRNEKQLVQREAKKARDPEKRAKLQTLIQQMVGTCVHTIQLCTMHRVLWVKYQAMEACLNTNAFLAQY